MDLSFVVDKFAESLSYVDKNGPPHKHFAPGIGPYGEGPAVRAALKYLKENYLEFERARTKQTPDLLIPKEWAIEFKIIRPFGDNGNEAEHWSENILHPYSGNTSSLGDCMKLLQSNLMERKAVVVFGYEHTPPKIDLLPAVKSFELIASEIMGIKLSSRYMAEVKNLRHPVHQQLKVFGWEVLD